MAKTNLSLELEDKRELQGLPYSELLFLLLIPTAVHQRYHLYLANYSQLVQHLSLESLV
jgi:hypothetical protein